MLVASFYSPRQKDEAKWNKPWKIDYDELLMLVEASCRRFKVQHLVISDKARPLPLMTYFAKLDDENLVKSFVLGQKQLLDFAREPVLFIGADCLLTKDPRTWTKDSDLAITLGPFADCEMNMGAVWCNNPYKCARIWERAFCEKKLVSWGDDQRAVYSAILEAEERGEVRVNRLQCEQHNWAPDSLEDDCKPTVVHFRGSRKKFMLEWAKKHLNLEPVEAHAHS
jgi:hypothetical protein